MSTEVETTARLAVAALAGLAVGVEREWSGHASGPTARFAGARTFFLLGLLGGFAGWLAESGFVPMALVFVAGGLSLAVAAYVMAVARGAGVDGTTEAAATLVLMLGVVAGLGYLVVASGAAALVVLVLAEKTRIHGFVKQIGQQELQAALYFAVDSGSASLHKDFISALRSPAYLPLGLGNEPKSEDPCEKRGRTRPRPRVAGRAWRRGRRGSRPGRAERPG